MPVGGIVLRQTVGNTRRVVKAAVTAVQIVR